MTRRRKKHRPDEIVAKLRDADAMLNAGKDLAAVLKALEVRDSGRVEFRYEFNGERLESWMPVHQRLEVLALRESQEIDILVDATRPRRAAIRHLFM